MTPDELKKEAERILGIARNPDTLHSTHIGMAVERLRAVHEAGCAEGFQQAKEKAEKIVQVRIDERYSSDCQVEAEQMRDEIRALLSGE